MSERLDSLLVGPDATVRDAMEAIGRGAVEVALVVDERRRLLGTVTDGDIRRALLGGTSLDDPIGPHAQADFTAVEPDTDRAWVLDLMQARTIGQVPVLGPDGAVIGLHVLRELVGRPQLRNVAVILAGGRGTRLRPLTESMPKPLLPVAGRPILERIVLHLVGAGIGRILLAVNYGADQIESHFGNGERHGCTIEYLREDPDHPLGTAGALRLLPTDVLTAGDSVVVMNGDLVTQFDVAALLRYHADAGNAVTVGVRDYVHDVPFGVVDDDGDRVVSIREKPSLIVRINAGVYAVQPEVVDYVPEGVEHPMTEVVAAAIGRDERVGFHALDGEWIDVGRFSDLRRAREGEK